MRYENNERLREYLDRGAAGAYRENMRHPSFEIDATAFAATMAEVQAQHPGLTAQEMEARAAFRLLTSGAPPEVVSPLPSRRYRTEAWTRRVAPHAWKWMKLGWAIGLLLLAAKAAHGEPRRGPKATSVNAGANAGAHASANAGSRAGARGASTEAENAAALRAVHKAVAGWSLFEMGAPADTGVILQFQNQSSVLATRPAGLVVFNCGSNLTCSFSGSTFNLAASGTVGAAFGNIATGTNTGATMTVGSGGTLNHSGSGVIDATRTQGFAWSASAPGDGQVPIYNVARSDWEPGDPIVSGPDAAGIAPTRNFVQIGAVDNSTACAGSSACTRSMALANATPGGGEYGLIVRNIPSGTQAVSGTFWQATQPVSLASLPALAAGTNAIGHVIADSGSTTAVTGNVTVVQTTGSNLHVDVDTALPAGTNAIGSITNTGFAVTGSLPAGSNVIGAVTGSGNFAQGETNSAGTNQAHIGCDKSVVYDASTSGSTQLVALSAGKSIYVCGYNLFSAGTANVKLTYGTGTACATGTTSLTPAYQLIAQTGMSYGNGEGTVATVPASDALCINSSAAIAVQALVSYAQF